MALRARADRCNGCVQCSSRQRQRSERQHEADAAVIKRYSTNAVGKRCAQKQKRDREILRSYFLHLTSQRVGQMVRGKSVFQTFVDLYSCEWQRADRSLAPKLEDPATDKDKALAGDGTPEDEVLAAKRYLRKKFLNTNVSRRGAYIPRPGVEVIVIDDDSVAIPDVPATETVPGQDLCCICGEGTNSPAAVRCRGSKAHVFCHQCIHVRAQASVGEGAAHVRCPITYEGCTAPFRSDQFAFLKDADSPEYDPKLFEQIDELQMREDLVMTGHPDDAVCPFCMVYREQYPPIAEHPEFRCGGKTCGKKSCRLCHKEAHAGKTCQQAQELALATSKHGLRGRFDEGLTDVTTRRCNVCQRQSYLADGCNKVTCVCGHLQCYLCGHALLPNDDPRWTPEERVRQAYLHFVQDGADDGRCPLYSNIKLLHCHEGLAAIQKISDQISTELPGIERNVLDEVRTEVEEREKLYENELLKQEAKSAASREAYRRRAPLAAGEVAERRLRRGPAEPAGVAVAIH